MVAPLVAVAILMLSEPPLKLAEPGLMLGVATLGMTVYVAAATSLAAIPLLNARARSFVVAVKVRRLHADDELVGSVLLVVQRITAPPVAVVALTVTDRVKVPEEGLRIGAAAGWRTVYAADTMSLGAIPPLNARALIVAELVSVTGPRYCVELDVGAVPSVV